MRIRKLFIVSTRISAHACDIITWINSNPSLKPDQIVFYELWDAPDLRFINRACMHRKRKWHFQDFLSFFDYNQIPEGFFFLQSEICDLHCQCMTTANSDWNEIHI